MSHIEQNQARESGDRRAPGNIIAGKARPDKQHKTFCYPPSHYIRVNYL